MFDKPSNPHRPRAFGGKGAEGLKMGFPAIIVDSSGKIGRFLPKMAQNFHCLPSTHLRPWASGKFHNSNPPAFLQMVRRVIPDCDDRRS